MQDDPTGAKAKGDPSEDRSSEPSPPQPSPQTSDERGEEASAAPSGEAPPSEAATPPDEACVALPAALLFAWAALALINASFILSLGRPPGGWSVRAIHLAFDLGNLLSLGLLSAGAAGAWQRWGDRRAALGYVALALLAVVVGFWTLPGDLDNFVHRKLGEPHLLWRSLLVVVVSCGVPCAAVCGRLLRRPWLRSVAVAGAGAAAVVNHLIMRSDYPGAHLFLAWAAATGLASALVGARVPAKLVATGRFLGQRRTVRLGVLAGASLAGAVSLVIWPSPSVLVETFRTNGSVLFPFLAQVRGDTEFDELGQLPGRHIHPDWLRPRPPIPPIGPSAPRLIADQPIIIFVCIDAVRHELLVEPKYRAKLPRLTELADRSVHFTALRTAGTTTRNSLGSLFTSKLSDHLRWSYHKRRGRNLHFDATLQFSEALQRNGYATLNIVAGRQYPSLLRSKDVVKGFTEEKVLRPRHQSQKWALADAVMDAAIERLRAHGAGPLFIFMHMLDPHSPYDSAGEEGSEFEGYLNEVAFSDTQVGRLYDELATLQLLDRAVLVITSDHGEAFGQHNIPYHGISLYEEVVRVPLLIYWRGIEPRKVHAAVSSLDIAPTLLDLAGLPTPGDYFGQSLVPFLRGLNPRLQRPVGGQQAEVRGLVLGRYKVIEDRKKRLQEVYDLVVDPMETNNLYGQLDGEGVAMIQTLRAYFKMHKVQRSKPRGRKQGQKK